MPVVIVNPFTKERVRMAPTTRERMIQSAVALFREQGYTGTGFREVVEHSGTPRGSIYHHFPGGKTELGLEAVRATGEAVERSIRKLTDSEDPGAAVEAFMASRARMLEASDFRAGCPVLAVAAETHPEAPELARAAADAFERWEGALAEAFRRKGLDRGPARSLATLVVASFEGALVMSRAAKDVRPLKRAGREIRRLIEAALPA